jgi:N6-L-threonylcarbamoyladenine synthase
LDDAAGEAFDKAAKLMNIGYPGGPVIEKASKKGNPEKYHFPRSLTGSTGKKTAPQNRFNFSFSGVKTSLLYHCEKLGGGEQLDEQTLYDTAASYQEAIIDALCVKTLNAADFFSAKSIVLCGGVACNSILRERLREKTPANKQIYISPKKYCTDNAAMVAGLAWHHLKNGITDNLNLDAYARLPEITTVPFKASS